MKKILRVFRERQIYSEEKVDRLTNAVTSSLTGIRLVEFNIELGGTVLSTESIQKSRQTPTTPPNVGKAVDSPHLSTPTVDTDSPEPKKVSLFFHIYAILVIFHALTFDIAFFYL